MKLITCVRPKTTNIAYFKDVVDDLFTVEELYGCYSVRTIGGKLLTVVDSPAQLLRYVGNTLGLQAYSNLRAALRGVTLHVDTGGV